MQGRLEGPYAAGDGEKYRTQLKVNSVDGAVEWVAVDEERDWGLGYTTPHPFHWSSDGRYLYFTNLPVPDGCALFVNGSDLNRLDLTSGEVIQVVPEVGLVLSLSPDESTLAYMGYGATGELTLRDLLNGSERKVPLGVEGGRAGNIVWSPDHAALMLVTTMDVCDPQAQSIVHVDVLSLETTVLVENDPRLLTIVEWTGAERALLADKDGNPWSLDPATGELAPAE